MKHTLTAIALALAVVNTQAQTTVDSTSGSASNSGAASQSGAAVNATNSGNVTATGNENASRSDSASRSGAVSGSQSGALGNSVYVDQRGPVSQTVNSNLSGTTTQNQNTTLNGTQTVNGNSTSRETYDGTQRVISSGGVNNTNFSREEVRYSGTYTVKSAPAIAMSGPASGPCTGNSGGIGLSGPGWGVGLNGSAVMDDCRMRENTRVLGMGMQSLDGTANPQEKGEATVMFMDAMRNLAAYNNTIYSRASKDAK